MRNGSLRRVGPVFAAFVLVAVGVLVLAGGNKKSADATSDALRPTVIALAPISQGASVESVGSQVEIRMLPTNARAEGVVESVDELPDGVLSVDLVPGQQVLTSMIVDDVRKSLGNGRVAVSARLDPAQWTGPVATTGTRVNVYAIGGSSAELIATDVIVLSSPDPSTLTPQQEAVVTLGVTDAQVSRVIGAVSGAGVWLVTA